ncbi:TPA: helix-turn-helix transcriptional regulator [Clostridium botulinum]|nr:helix-turn-helix transcriptional regulator [Clostridium botulinum]
MNTIGEIIKDFRTANSLSLREFSKLCDLSHSYIDRLEKGYDPRSGKKVDLTIDTIGKIASCINMDLYDLLIAIGAIKNFSLKDNKSKLTLRQDLINLMLRRNIIKDKENINLKHIEFIEYAISLYKENL